MLSFLFLFNHERAHKSAGRLSPVDVLLSNLILWKQKRRGSNVSRAYPKAQAFALPLHEDKQRKPAHAERYIYTTAWASPMDTDSQAYGYTTCRHPTIYTQREYTHLSGVHLIIYIKGINSRRRI